MQGKEVDAVDDALRGARFLRRRSCQPRLLPCTRHEKKLHVSSRDLDRLHRVGTDLSRIEISIETAFR